jgi:hypothetical protein
VCEFLLGCFRGQQPDPGALLRAGFGEHELGAALEAQTEGRRLRPLFTGGEVAKPPRGHQVNEQHELAVLGRKEQPLASPLGARESPAVERRKRRVEGLQSRDVRRPGLLDRKGADGLVQGASPRLHLR